MKCPRWQRDNHEGRRFCAANTGSHSEGLLGAMPKDGTR